MGEGKGLIYSLRRKQKDLCPKLLFPTESVKSQKKISLKERHNILSQLLKHKTMLNLRETPNHLFDKEEK